MSDEEDDEVPYKPTDMELVAGAGSLELSGLPEDRALEAAEKIISAAPLHLREDFHLCCALHIYRMALIKAVEKNDVGQMYAAQSAILGLIEVD